MKQIALSRDKVALVDDDCFDELCKYNWYASRPNERANSIWYAKRRTLAKDGPRVVVYMHRAILNAEHGFDVDHIDGNGLNNQRANLRICRHRDNMLNRRKSTGSSVYRGVSLDRATGRWLAYVSLNELLPDGRRRLKNLGKYDTELEAAMVRDEFARKLHGEFARLNFPDT